MQEKYYANTRLLLRKCSSSKSMSKTTASSFYTSKSSNNTHLKSGQFNYSELSNKIESYYYPLNEKDLNSPVNFKDSTELYNSNLIKKLNEWDKENTIRETSLKKRLIMNNISGINKKPIIRVLNKKDKNVINISQSSLNASSVQKCNQKLENSKNENQSKNEEDNKNLSFNMNIQSSHQQLLQKIDKYTFLQFEKQKEKQEQKRYERLLNVYKKIILNKIKRKKYEEILNDSFTLLDSAKTEYDLSVDVLKDRIKAVQKYYEAFRNSIEQEEKENNKSKNLKKAPCRKNSVTFDETQKQIFEERAKKYSEYVSIVEGINKEIESYDQKYNSIKKELTAIIKMIKETISSIKTNTDTLKKTYNVYLLEEKNYYIDLLKKGQDCRKEGMSWIIKRLLEIGTKIELSYFPKYLEDGHIAYLVRVAELKLEKQQLEAMASQFQLRQAIEKEKQNPNALAKEIEQKMLEFMQFDYSFYNKKLKNFFFDKYKDILQSTFISPQVAKKIEIVFKDYIILMRELCNNILNNNYIKKTVDKIKIAMANNNFDIKIETPKPKNPTITKTEYRDDLAVLDHRIKEIFLLVNALIKSEYKKFKEKSSYFLHQYKDHNEYYEYIYRALFGSTVFK